MSITLAHGAEELWASHNAAWRSTAQVASQWQDAEQIDPKLLTYEVSGQWWETVQSLGLTLLIGREYEHLLMGVSCVESPAVSFMPMPHPSGIAIDRHRAKVFVASTRNPNQIYELQPASEFVERNDLGADMRAELSVHAHPQQAPQTRTVGDSPLIPTASRFLPGCMYIHDLAFIDDQLHANAVGQNCVVKFDRDFAWHRVWWPKCVQSDDSGTADFRQNYIQLNSIAAGKTLSDSFFTASSDQIGDTRPGDPAYPVDKRGVLFSGATREPVVRGLTRPHSARFDSKGSIWLANSGYGQFGYVEGDRFVNLVSLPGWTRGVCICQNVAFVGTSRVIPKFSSYAPGLKVESSVCGVHAIDLRTGAILGSFTWSSGNQIFAIDWLPSEATRGMPFSADDPKRDRKTLFYTFATGLVGQGACND